jgi:hypothetical protein
MYCSNFVKIQLAFCNIKLYLMDPKKAASFAYNQGCDYVGGRILDYGTGGAYTYAEYGNQGAN